MRTLTRWITSKFIVLLLLSVFALPLIDSLTVATVKAASPAEDAAAIFQATGITGGLIVHLGCGQGELTAALQANSRYQVHGLDRDMTNVAVARQRIRSLGTYGEVAVDQLRGKELPYTDNLVNLVIVEESQGITAAEVMRVLVPLGVAYVQEDGQWVKKVKPRSKELDEWTHYLYDSSGNAVAHDSVVGPPRHLQWVGSPRWSRHHDRMASMSALVASGGKIFYIMDEGSRISIQLPPRWTLICRDAFNGVILWKHPITDWQNHLWPLKSGPTQLTRRLVVTTDRVYVTLGLHAPLTELDAVTGKVLQTYEGTKTTEEVITKNGTHYLLVNDGETEVARYAPGLNLGDQRRVATEFHWNGKPRTVMAVDAASGRILWRHKTPVAPLTLSAQQDRVLFHDGDKVVCLDRVTGKPAWSSPPAPRRANVTMNFGPKLVLYKDVVLYAGGDRKMQVFDLKTGKQLWTAPHAQSGYQSPEDLLVAGGLVWSAPTTQGRQSGTFTGRDPWTGEVKREFSPNVSTYWFHHRCYIAKATDKFLMTSRTGIEFVDHEKKDWDIHHWVRGGCLYGIMPCNGMVYAPPHDCACYPEAKLYGMNALAPAAPSRQITERTPEAQRLLRGPAYGEAITQPATEKDWPTFRGNTERSGFTRQTMATELANDWTSKLGGRLSSVVIAGGKVFVAQIDAHTMHALDAATGKPAWSYVTGGRVDSPPTFHDGRVLFGSADGCVYCLRASDGALIWRFQAAPQDRRLMAFEQLESVWPVHGNILIYDGKAYFVAGRSAFLDGGLKWYKLDVKTGQKISEIDMNEKDPETGKSLQSRIQVLNMPVGLPDILASDGSYVYMRSQRFDFDGKREEIGPHSGTAAEQGGTQTGEGVHLFSPTGYLDGSWFHRSYWVYGRSFAGGHNGYYQAGKYAPSGRIIVCDDSNVYGFGRKPQYLRWTTTLEHQLFSTSKEAPEVKKGAAGGGSMVQVAKSQSLNPAGQAITAEAWANPDKNGGVVLAHGGPAIGYALSIEKGKPRFSVRFDSKLHSITGLKRVVKQWSHLVGVLTPEKQMRLYVNGKLVATGKAGGLIGKDPVQGLEIGGDAVSSVGNYQAPFTFTGVIDEVRVYHGVLTDAEVRAHFREPGNSAASTAKLVLAYSFNDGKAQDSSGNKNHGTLVNAKPDAGKLQGGMRFSGKANAQSGSFVKHHWTEEVPVFVRAMVLADKTLFVAGPPDLIDEEDTFEKLVKRDPKVQAVLAQQDKVLNGSEGALIRAVSAQDGQTESEFSLPSLPVWDGMAIADGYIYIATEDGTVLRLKASK